MAKASKGAREGLTTTCDITFPGVLGARPQALLAAVAQLASSAINQPLREIEPGAPLESLQWAPVLNPRGEYQGALQVKCDTHEEAALLYGSLQGEIISINGECKAVSVYNAQLAARGHGGGRGAVQLRRTAPTPQSRASLRARKAPGPGRVALVWLDSTEDTHRCLTARLQKHARTNAHATTATSPVTQTEAGPPLPLHKTQLPTCQDTTIPRTPGHQRKETKPFTGGFQARYWNAQAFFAAKASRHGAKRNYAYHLARGADILGLGETHGKAGYELTLRQPRELDSWWSHGAVEAGVGLIVKKTFLQQFTAIEWVDSIAEGAAAMLRLEGPHGALDVVVLYLKTGCCAEARRERARVAESLARLIRPANRALTLTIGDWNFVREGDDRTNLQEWDPTRNAADVREHDQLANILFDRHGLKEIRQELTTHRNAIGTSRIDRAYVNPHLADSFTHDWKCRALEWKNELSTHRAIEVTRTAKGAAADKGRALPTGPLGREDWAPRVRLRWQELKSADPHEPTAARKLQLIKQAIREVTMRMDQRLETVPRTNPGDQLGCAIKALKALDAKRWHRVESALKELPGLSGKCSLHKCAEGDGVERAKLQDAILQYAKADIITDLEQLRQDRQSGEHGRQVKRECIGKKLAKLRPGGFGTVGALLVAPETVVTDPADIAKGLGEHWEKTFQARGICTEILRDWIREAAPTWEQAPMEQNARAWRVRRKDIARAVRYASNTAPGPDGLTARHWKALGRTAAEALADVAGDMQNGKLVDQLAPAEEDVAESPGEHRYNLSCMVCIPKKPIGCSPEHGDIYAPETTRPLMIVNMDNRIVAAAFKHRWQSHLEQWISPGQRGFLRGRSMIANIVDIEQEAMVTGLRDEDGMLMFFDFRAAFPSISHEYMQECLKGMGAPGLATEVLRALYHQGRCKVSQSKGAYPGFDITSGIRQGCPLSPLIFVTVMDLLLRILQIRLGEGCMVRAFADDVGMVLRDAKSQLPVVQRIMEEFGQISGAELNLTKTVAIPLGEQDLSRAKESLRQAAPGWEAIPVRHSATYLGHVIGPKKGPEVWASSITKFTAKARAWDWGALGLHFAARVHNTYLLPVLGFTAQMATPTPEVLQAEEKVTRKAAPGPGMWASRQDLADLGRWFGLPVGFKKIATLAKAAQLRIHTWEHRKSGGLLIQRKAQELERWARSTDHIDRLPWWASWRRHAVVQTLHENKAALEEQGIRANDIISQALAKPLTECGPQDLDKVQKQFQRKVSQTLEHSESPSPIDRVRVRLERWQLGPNRRLTAERFLYHLEALRALTPPRVSAAVFSTGWNRWCTARRHQRRHHAVNRCLLGCGGMAEDSVEHYSRCAAVRTFHDSTLRIREDWLLPGWLGTQATAIDPVTRTLWAVGAYAVYRTTNAARQRGHLSHGQAVAALKQAAKEGVLGHTKACLALDSVWATSKAATPGKQESTKQGNHGRRQAARPAQARTRGRAQSYRPPHPPATAPPRAGDRREGGDRTCGGQREQKKPRRTTGDGSAQQDSTGSTPSGRPTDRTTEGRGNGSQPPNYTTTTTTTAPTLAKRSKRGHMGEGAPGSGALETRNVQPRTDQHRAAPPPQRAAPGAETARQFEQLRLSRAGDGPTAGGQGAAPPGSAGRPGTTAGARTPPGDDQQAKRRRL